MNVVRIVADEPTQDPAAALAIYRNAPQVCVCFGHTAQAASETMRQAQVAFQPLVEALNMVKVKFYAEGTFDADGSLRICFTCADFAHICWALSMAELESQGD